MKPDPLHDVMHTKISPQLIVAILVAATVGFLIGRQFDNRLGFVLSVVFVIGVYSLRRTKT